MKFKESNQLSKRYSIYFLILVSSSLTTYIVSTNFVSIHDLAYFLTNGLRISQGQIPYLDFILVHTPGSFYLIALFIKIFGTTYLPIYLWMYFVNFLTTVMIYQILIKIKIKKAKYITIFFGLLAPYSFQPQIWYDSDSIFFIVLTIYLLFFVDFTKNLFLVNFTIGLISFIPYFVKQNIGLVNFFIINLLLVFFDERPKRNKIIFFSGQFFAIFIFLFYLFYKGAIFNFYKYTFKHAIASRLGSIIPEIFPIRIIEKYDLSVPFGNIYIYLYIIVSLLSFLILLNNIKKTKNRLIFTQFVVTIFITIIYLDNLVFENLVLFSKNYFLNINISKNYLILVLFILLTLLNIIISNLKVPKKNLESIFSFIFLFVTTLLSGLYVFELFQLQKVQEFVKVSFKYNLMLMFFITFPIITICFKLKYDKGNKIIFFVIPLVGYIYSTSLSQGLAGSISGGTGIIIVLFFLITEKFYKKELIHKFIFILSFALFLSAIFGSRYHFIKFENEPSSFSELSILKTPSSHYLQQEIAEEILIKYKENYENIIFAPEATTAYFSTNYKIKADVHTFDFVTNPYSFNYDIYSIENFLECNSVDLVVINTNNSRVYFDQFIEFNNLDIYLGPNYVFKENYSNFIIFERNEIKVNRLDKCDL